VPFKPNREIQFQQVFLATDFGEDSLAALPYAVSLADEDYTQLALLHVVEQPAAGILDLDKVKASMARRLRELAPHDAEPWRHVECLVEFSDQFAPPAERILRIAKDRATDLIVVGARPTRGGVSAVTHFAHSTAQHIVARAACPVLTVRV